MIWRLRCDGAPTRTPELEALASARVGEGAQPDLWFVSRDGVILSVLADPGDGSEDDPRIDENGEGVPPAVWAVTRALRADMVESRRVGVLWEHPAKLAAYRLAEDAGFLNRRRSTPACFVE